MLTEDSKCEGCGGPMAMVHVTADDVWLCEGCYNETPTERERRLQSPPAPEQARAIAERLVNELEDAACDFYGTDYGEGDQCNVTAYNAAELKLDNAKRAVLAALCPEPRATGWQPIATAPKDAKD